VEPDLLVVAVVTVLIRGSNRCGEFGASRVKTLLCSHGFPNVLNNPYVVNSKAFVCIFKRSVRDAFIQSWQSDQESNQVLCSLYKHIKTDFPYEIYLDQVTSPALRRLITQMLTSGHILRIETGRHGQQRLERFERCCQVCGSGDVEDEFHFVFKCEVYADIRHVYINSYYYRRPSVMKLLSL